MLVSERRASVVLFKLLRSRADPRPYLLPANVCPVVPAAFALAQQPFVIVDIAEPWLEIDPDASMSRVRDRPNEYGGLVFVRPYGSERDPTSFFNGLKDEQPDLFIIDDKCLCRPDCDGERLSPRSDATLFSTGRAKYADIGGGGFAHLAPSVLYADVEPASVDWLDLTPEETAWTERRRHTIEAIRAADEQKTVLNEIYRRVLPREIQFPDELQRWRFNIRVPRPELLIDSIFAAGLFASRHYPPVVAGEFPIASRVHETIVNLFSDRHFDPDRARRISELVLRHLEQSDRLRTPLER
ncbi:MAG: hypothetical protein JJE51_04935 [Thermoanaerobaculia bacterium]|nr:hypothetical protein [Thermoanaerobaculia bacterium]